MRCYKCDEETSWLAPDSRCKDCTTLTPEQVMGEEPITEPDLDEEEELNFSVPAVRGWY